MNIYNNKLCSLAFSHCNGIGPLRFTALINRFGDAQKAYQAESKGISQVIGKNWAEKFNCFRKKFDPIKKEQELQKKDIIIVDQSDKYYPKSLKAISDPPICLYVKGKIDLFDVNKDIIFAVVGTRQPTSYGRQIARQLCFDLAQTKVVIVSGMAMGIDTIAHQAALDAESRTIAVLGCGVDIIYPAINTKLYYQIINKGGLIISEFPPGHTVIKGLFVARNRIISGLSRGVLIVEGAERSGALITARYAAEQGREVFALPGPLTSTMSIAPNLLLKQGAKLVTSVEDIFEELNLKVVHKKKEEIAKHLNNEEKRIFEILSNQPATTDDLIIQTKQAAGKLLSILSIMEVKGLLIKDGEGKYQIR